jgi:hypothetical protein
MTLNYVYLMHIFEVDRKLKIYLLENIVCFLSTLNVIFLNCMFLELLFNTYLRLLCITNCLSVKEKDNFRKA